jgi:hypothetical protein
LKGEKLSPRYIGSFQIIERIGIVAYHLSFLDGLIGSHDMFHELQLKNYNPDPEHILNEEPFLLNPNLTYV